MANTIRTTDALLALYADNITNSITEQDGRDLIVSKVHWGEDWDSSVTYYGGTVVLRSGTLYFGVARTINPGVDPATNNAVEWFPIGVGNGGVTPTPTPTAAPADVTPTGYDGMVGLTWSAVPGATSYAVTRSTDSVTGYGDPATVIGTHYDDGAAGNGTTYYYRVAATSGGGTGPASAAVSGQATATMGGSGYASTAAGGTTCTAATSTPANPWLSMGTLASGAEAWWSFTPNQAGQYVIISGDSPAGETTAFDTVLDVYTGTCSALTPFASNDDGANDTVNNRASKVVATLTAETTYLIRLTGFNGAAGAYAADVKRYDFGS